MNQRRGRRRPLFAALGFLVGAAAAGTILRRLDTVEVAGASMAPALLPGDRLLVESFTYTWRAPAPGDVVLARDPRLPARELVKRVASIDGGIVELRGDAASASTDSRAFGPVPGDQVAWRAVMRYWPPGRIGWIRSPLPSRMSDEAAS
jgi:nickel-type superoxide dismutase maturation protease